MTDLSISDHPTTRPEALKEGEIKFLSLAVIAFIAIVSLSAWRGQAIDWMSFLPGYVYSLALLGIGLYIRLFKAGGRLATVAIALAGYALFGISMGIVFHIFMPRPEPILDEFLLQFDHLFGYHWPDAVVWLASEQAWLGKTLSYVYMSSFAQLLLLVVVLGATDRPERLNVLLTTGMIGLFFTFVVWQLFPNFSMGIHYPIPADAERAINLVTNSAYGAMLKDMALNGIPVISMDMMLGVVAFPSYHTVMACLVVWFAYKTVMFWPALLLNIAMVPAIHIHGAHHILDFIGGIAVFFAALYAAKVFLNSRSRVMRWPANG
ncbi:MAG: phosphatase PAP2 family protein [Sulfitobacter sp.]